MNLQSDSALANKPLPLGSKQFEDLARLQPADVCRRGLVQWDQSGFYSVPFLGKDYRVFPAKGAVESTSGDPLCQHPEFRLVLLCYLLYAQDMPFVSRWISEKDLKGGSMFFKGPHALPSLPIIKAFGNDPQGFLAAGKGLGAEPLAGYGDAALVFSVLPRIRVACVLWAEDDEFPARAAFLFDPSVESQLPLDVVLPLVKFLVKTIIK